MGSHWTGGREAHFPAPTVHRLSQSPAVVRLSSADPPRDFPLMTLWAALTPFGPRSRLQIVPTMIIIIMIIINVGKYAGLGGMLVVLGLQSGDGREGDNASSVGAMD